MAVPPAITPQEPGAAPAPTAVPLPLATARVSPPATASVAWVSGAVVGATVSYADLNASAFYTPGGGMSTRNRGGRRYTSSLHGLEDGARRRRD